MYSSGFCIFRFFYNLFLPIGFLFYIPDLLYKYRNRGGWKSTFGERFARFGVRKKELNNHMGAIWVHAVSVGETVVALALINRYLELHPDRKFILSTTTTTGQDVARERCPNNTKIIFCPLDFPWMVRRTLELLKPAELVIFETEIWPNLIIMAQQRGIPVALVNGRMSDHSARGYYRARCFFGPLLKSFDKIMVQSPLDLQRYSAISPHATVLITGNLKFDQPIPKFQEPIDLESYFGPGRHSILLAASTHPGEDKRILESFLALKPEFPSLKLIIIPRHAERGADIAEILKQRQVSFLRRSVDIKSKHPVEALLADTTGEMMRFIAVADVVIMGKSFAGHDEGHNLIEPALLGKAIVTGPVLRNFKEILQILQQEDAVLTATDAELTGSLRALLHNQCRQLELGKNAKQAINRHRGASDRTIKELETLYLQFKKTSVNGICNF